MAAALCDSSHARPPAFLDQTPGRTVEPARSDSGRPPDADPRLGHWIAPPLDLCTRRSIEFHLYYMAPLDEAHLLCRAPGLARPPLGHYLKDAELPGERCHCRRPDVLIA